MIDSRADDMPENDIGAAFGQSSSTTANIHDFRAVSTESSAAGQSAGLVSRIVPRYRGGVKSIGEGAT